MMFDLVLFCDARFSNHQVVPFVLTLVHTAILGDNSAHNSSLFMAPCDPFFIDQMIVCAKMLSVFAGFQRCNAWNEQNENEADQFEMHWRIWDYAINIMIIKFELINPLIP